MIPFLLFLILIFNCGCIDKVDGSDEVNNELVIGISENTFGFFPWIESYDVSTISMNHNIFNTLVGFDNIFRVKAELAESWNNPDNITWRFRLRKGVTFHNGYDLTAEDVKYSIDRILNDKDHVLNDLLLSVNETRVVDNLTIDIITKEPCPILLNKLTDIFIGSKKYLEETDIKSPIGTGAYRLLEHSYSNYTILESYDDYWRGKPDFDKVTFKIIENCSERKDALLSNDIDIAASILTTYYDNLSKNPDINLYTITTPTVTYLGLDFREYNYKLYGDQKNPLSDIRVRKALYHAIDIESLIEKTSNQTMLSDPATQYITPMIYGYNPDIERLDYDLDESRRLLNESGYPNGFDLVLDCSVDYFNQLSVCEIIEQQLSEITNISLRRSTTEEYFGKIIQKNTSFYIIGWMAATGDGGEIYDYLLRSNHTEEGIGLYNCGYYYNPEVDRIAVEIAHNMDFKDRLGLMQDGFDIAMDDVACIPLVSSKMIYGARDYIDWVPYSNMNIIVENIKLKK